MTYNEKSAIQAAWLAEEECIELRKLNAEPVAVLSKLTGLASNVCAATDGIAVINAVATLRPAIADMRAVLAKVQS